MISNRCGAQVEPLERRQLLSAELIYRDSELTNAVAYNGLVYFAKTDSSHGRELWQTDGTSANTHLFMDLNPGPADSNPSALQVVGRSLYFVAHADNKSWLWRTDGTAADTQKLMPGVSARNHPDLPIVLSTGSHTYAFQGFDGIHALPSQKYVDTRHSIYQVAATNESLYYAGDSDKQRLYRYDGTIRTTVMARSASRNFDNLTGAGANRFFTYPEPNGISDLYVTTGGASPTLIGSFPTLEKIVAAGSTAYFLGRSASQGDGTWLWSSDGTIAGTVPLKRIWQNSSMPDPQLVASGDGVFFSGEGTIGTGTELWHSDGTPDGTGLVKDLCPDDGGADPEDIVPDGKGGAAFIAVTHRIPDQFPYDLYRTDGTPDGTRLIDAFGEYPTDFTSIAPLNKYVLAWVNESLLSVDPDACLVAGHVYVGSSPGVGYTVFLDSNRNGIIDSGERSAITGSDGTFQFAKVAAGNVQVRILPIANGQTFTSATAFTRKLQAGTEFHVRFEAANDPRPGMIQGHVFRDLNGNGTIDADESGQSGIIAWIDSNKNGALDAGEPATTSDASGNFEFDVVPDVDYQVAIQGGKKFDVEQLYSGEAMPGPAQTTNVTFAVEPRQHVTGVVFDDANGNGAQDSGEPGLQGEAVHVYVDFYTGDEFLPYTSKRFAATTDSNGDFGLFIPMLHSYSVRPVSIPGRRQTTHEFSGESQPGGQVQVTIGMTRRVNIEGTLFNDANLNQTFDSGERIIPHDQVYLDLNNNGQLDGNEPSLNSGDAGSFEFSNYVAGTYVVRQTVPAHWVDEGGLQAHAKPGSVVTADLGSYQLPAISARLTDNDGTPKPGYTFYLDLNNNGQLDPAEPSQETTASKGTVYFGDLKPGTYTVRWVPVKGYRIEGAESKTYTLLGGDHPTAKFVLTARATIQGHLFIDKNRDGKFEASKEDPFIYTVFLDSNHNGIMDGGEPVDVTVGGVFSFAELKPGTYWLTASSDPDYVMPAVQKITITSNEAVEVELPMRPHGAA